MVTMMERAQETRHDLKGTIQGRINYLNLVPSVNEKKILKWLNVNETFDPYLAFNYDKRYLPCHPAYMQEYYNIFVQLGNKYGVHCYTPGTPHPNCPVIYCSRYAWKKWRRIMPGWIAEQEIRPGHPALNVVYKQQYSYK